MQHAIRQRFLWATPEAPDEAERILEEVVEINVRNFKGNGTNNDFCFFYEDRDDYKEGLGKIAHLLKDGSYIFFWSDDDYDLHLVVVYNREVVDLDHGWKVEEFMDPFVDKAMNHDPCFHREDLPKMMLTSSSNFVRAICKRRLNN